MKKTLNSLIYLFPILFGIYIFCFFYIKYPYHFHYREQFQLFQFTSEYFMQLSSRPGGISDYLSVFFTQFFYHAWLGALIITLCLIGIQQLTFAIAGCFRDNPVWAPLSYLPVVLCVYLFCDENYMLGGIIALIFCLLFILGGLHVRSHQIRRIYLLVMIPVIYWIAGGVVSVFVAILLLYEWLKVKEKGKPLVILSFVAVFLVIACPFLAKYFLLQYPLYRFFWGVTYIQFVTIQPLLIVVLWVLITAIPVLFYFLPPLKKEKRRLIVFFVNIVCLICIAFYSMHRLAGQGNEWKEELMAYDYHCRMKQWDEIVRMADKKAPNIPMTVTCLNLALYKTGQLPEKMFHYYQNGTEGLLPIFRRDYMQALVSGEPYYYLGFVNTAQRYAFEAMEALPDYQKSVRCIQRLVETNIINGQYKVAEKYLLLLENTLFYRKWAQEVRTYLYDEARIDAHPEWGELRRFRTKDDFLFSDQERNMMLGFLFQQDRDNKMAYEYLLAYTLLTKDLQHFIDYFRMDKNFEYTTLPKSYQEALIYIWGLSSTNLDTIPFPISNSVKQQVAAYASIYTTQQNSEPILRRQFSDTYWYYYHFSKVKKEVPQQFFQY